MIMSSQTRPALLPIEGIEAFRAGIRRHHRIEEALLMRELVEASRLDPATRDQALSMSRALVERLRLERRNTGGVDALMHEYDLSSSEGVTLMCLAEALLRIPDHESQDDFIEDQLGAGDWQSRLGASDSFFVNASTFGLMMAGRTVGFEESGASSLRRLVKRLGEPVVREAVRHAMRILGRQFVLGRTIGEALDRGKAALKKGYTHSFDMLGEGARTMADADRYLKSYVDAIDAVGRSAKGNPEDIDSVSIKLSALHPRYEFAQRERVRSELLPRIESLCRQAAGYGIGICVDAEEADRLELSLDIMEALAQDPETRNWQGLGMAIQAYQRRATKVVDWAVHLASQSRRRLMLRLVKGAYWDTEIKHGQVEGLEEYPVFTRKSHTDVSFLACARAMLAARGTIWPAFATHNANSVAAILAQVGTDRDFEFQRLHGMGDGLYRALVEDGDRAVRCRIYAPVGGHEDLLAYLVRRLLENGANTSFVNRLVDDRLPVEEIVNDQVEKAIELGLSHNVNLPKPPQLFGAERRNSEGHDLTDPERFRALEHAAAPVFSRRWSAGPQGGEPFTMTNPANPDDVLGVCRFSTPSIAHQAMETARSGFAAWSARPVEERAAILERAADLFEAERGVLLGLIQREAGRTWGDAVSELREAVDFLRYYAVEARKLQGTPLALPGPTGERNTLQLVARGPYLCISPWNFPLAIFVGQVAAALVVGNTVIAKPAEQTPLIGIEAVRLLHSAGVPEDALCYLPGDGPTIGAALLGHRDLAGVVFTGSTETARIINRALADRAGGLLPLIAETGGINAMIVDSTALPEQVSDDVISSAFQSAGQRCSALRLLCLQEDIADRQLAMLTGALDELKLGDPRLLASDIGPVIDAESAASLNAYIESQHLAGRVMARGGAVPRSGHFVSPAIIRLDQVSDLKAEIFGPVLHVVTYKIARLEALIEQINQLGYGLTLGIHSRSRSRIRRVTEAAKVGNIYINRNQIGAVVGVQPFGGDRLSGTGPKAGGPHYLHRFVTERTVTTNTTAAGGNTTLMAMGDS
jgi:RHH-type transcriptional regulator, proline utilization regulon repressor / proline dehydrogenase / delta 1-pyrroline-5-carboxylate dehydrogenase